MSNFASLLLPKLWPSTYIQLGEFLQNPLNPSIRRHNPSLTFSLEDLDSSVDIPFQTAFREGTSKRLEASLTAYLFDLFKLVVGRERHFTVELTAESRTSKTLKDPTAALKEALLHKGVLEWVKEQKYWKKKMYFVVGLVYLNSAAYIEQMSREHEFNAQIRVSGEPILSVPAGLKLQGLILKDDEGFVGFRVVGESLFGVQVRRIECRKKKPDEPILADDIILKFSVDRVMGGPGQATEEEHILRVGEVVEEDELQEELKELEQDEGEEDDEEEEDGEYE